MNGSLLVLVFDTSPTWGDELVPLLADVGLAIRTFLALKQQNRIAVVSSHPCGASVLLTEPEMDWNRQHRSEVASKAVQALRAKLTEEPASAPVGVSGSAAALTRALCYVNRVQKQRPDLSPHVLSISRAADDSLSYVNTMNVLFALQRKQVVLDALAVCSSAPYLKQGTLLTSGLYREASSQFASLLLGLFLVPPPLRSSVAMPPPPLLDSRASCFCHGTPLEKGFVCSICLATYCKFVPTCAVCSSKFEFDALPSSSSEK